MKALKALREYTHTHTHTHTHTDSFKELAKTARFFVMAKNIK